MLKVLVKIANKLDRIGLTKEADLLDRILVKIAVPLEGVVDLHPYETLGYEESDEDGNVISNPTTRLPRSGNILRDRMNRSILQDRMNSQKGISPEEFRAKELSQWYDSVKAVGDSIILIPFDKSEVDKNLEILSGMAAIFGMRFGGVKNYDELFSDVNLLSGIKNKKGSLDALKEVFPSLWLDIQDILIKKDLKEEDVIYMFYNQENSPDRPGFTKDPFYFAHDLGHSDFDTEDADYFFKAELSKLILEVSKLYVSDDNETLFDMIHEAYEEDEIQELASDFFPTKGNQLDVFADIYSHFASGNLTIDDIETPDEIYYKGIDFRLKEDKIYEAITLFKNYIKDIALYLNPGTESGTYAPGPFKYLAGSVVLQDI